MRPTRRHFLAGSVATFTLGLSGLARGAIGEAGDLKAMTLPPPIGTA